VGASPVCKWAARRRNGAPSKSGQRGGAERALLALGPHFNYRPASGGCVWESEWDLEEGELAPPKCIHLRSSLPHSDSPQHSPQLTSTRFNSAQLSSTDSIWPTFHLNLRAHLWRPSRGGNWTPTCTQVGLCRLVSAAERPKWPPNGTRGAVSRVQACNFTRFVRPLCAPISELPPDTCPQRGTIWMKPKVRVKPVLWSAFFLLKSLKTCPKLTQISPSIHRQFAQNILALSSHLGHSDSSKWTCPFD